MQSLGLAPLSTSSSVLFEILFLLAFDQKSDTMRQCSLGRAVLCYLFFFALPATRIFSFAIFCDAVLSKSWQDKFFQTALFTWHGIFFASPLRSWTWLVVVWLCWWRLILGLLRGFCLDSHYSESVSSQQLHVI